MMRKTTNSNIYRMTTTLAVCGLILALAIHPAHADQTISIPVSDLDTVLVEQARDAMQNIAHDIVTSSDWHSKMADSLRDVIVEPEPEVASENNDSERHVADR